MNRKKKQLTKHSARQKRKQQNNFLPFNPPCQHINSAKDFCHCSPNILILQIPGVIPYFAFYIYLMHNQGVPPGLWGSFYNSLFANKTENKKNQHRAKFYNVCLIYWLMPELEIQLQCTQEKIKQAQHGVSEPQMHKTSNQIYDGIPYSDFVYAYCIIRLHPIMPELWTNTRTRVTFGTYLGTD